MSEVVVSSVKGFVVALEFELGGGGGDCWGYYLLLRSFNYQLTDISIIVSFDPFHKQFHRQLRN